MDDNQPIKVMDIMGFKTELFGRTVHAYERSMVEKWLAEKDTEIERLSRELAEARGLLREAKEKLGDLHNTNADQFVDDGIGLDGVALIGRIDAALASDQPTESCTCSQPGWATWDAPCPIHAVKSNATEGR
ncbi:MAG: hypothetical protein MUF79_14325 [Burkholderiales bacterium]|jgi:hypothetical protein|nr:hypothetical protein [Burkholderiales bacterium]